MVTMDEVAAVVMPTPRSFLGWKGSPGPERKVADESTTTHDLASLHGRLYQMHLSRFLTPDPVTGDPARPQSFHPYAYALNNPLRYTDPWGLDEEDTNGRTGGCDNVFEDVYSSARRSRCGPLDGGSPTGSHCPFEGKRLEDPQQAATMGVPYRSCTPWETVGAHSLLEVVMRQPNTHQFNPRLLRDGRIEVGVQEDEVHIYGTETGLKRLIGCVQALLAGKGPGHIHLEDYELLAEGSLKLVIARFDTAEKEM